MTLLLKMLVGGAAERPTVWRKLSSTSARTFGSHVVTDRICNFGTHHQSGADTMKAAKLEPTQN
jgi:hypothetical protein